MGEFSLNQLQILLQTVTDSIDKKPLNRALEDTLNEKFSQDSELYKAIKKSCQAGIDAGALCQHEAGGIRFGRAIKPCAELGNHSVDVVHMKDVKGPHHRHPQGEIDLIMPLSPDAKFDGHGAGWVVYSPDSAHCPTVTDGNALVLYLLPNGVIEFTRP